VWGAPRDGLDALFGAHGLRVVRVESPFGVRDVFLASRAWRRMPRSAGEVVVTVEGDAG
jgi:hypothetical protein